MHAAVLVHAYLVAGLVGARLDVAVGLHARLRQHVRDPARALRRVGAGAAHRLVAYGLACLVLHHDCGIITCV